MRKTTVLALTLTAVLAAAQPALAAKSNPSKSRTTTATQEQRDGSLIAAVKKVYKKFFGTKSFEQISTPVPKQP